MCQSKKIYTLADPTFTRLILEEMDPHYGDIWCPNRYINYTRLAGIWATMIAELKQHYPEMEYVFEGTPSHVVRYKKLLNVIPNAIVVASNRNPYAAISLRKKTFNPEYSEAEACRKYVHDWLVCSKHIKDACEQDHVPLVTYEQFCADPYTLLEAFGLSRHALRGEKRRLTRKRFKNKNEKRIARLSPKEKEIITAALSKHEELLSYFGYELLH